MINGKKKNWKEAILLFEPRCNGFSKVILLIYSQAERLTYTSRMYRPYMSRAVPSGGGAAPSR